MKLKSKFDKGEFAILAEMEPPKGVDVSLMLANAKRVKEAVDAFVVPEMSNAVMRVSSLGGALLLQKEGMETVTVEEVSAVTDYTDVLNAEMTQVL